MALSRNTAPAIQPVDLDDIKRHVRRAFSTDDDTALQAYLDAAVAFLDGRDGRLGRCMINQIWLFDVEEWCPEVALPFPDVSAVTVRYFDADDVEQTVAPDQYLLSGGTAPSIRFVSGFAAPALAIDRIRPIVIEMTVGFGATADNVPAPLRHAIRMLVGHWFVNREAVAEGAAPGEVPLGFDALIAPYRWISV